MSARIKLEIFKEGVLPENAEKFAEGADALVDGTDLSNLTAAVAMYKAARAKKICVFNANAIGFGVNLFVFGPNTTSFEDYLGLSKGVNPRMALTKLVPYVPTYINKGIVLQVIAGTIPIPNIAMPQYLGTSLAVSEVVMTLLGRVKPPAGPDPRIFILDLQDRKFSVTG